MYEILEEIVATLQADSTITAIVPTANIRVGRVDELSQTNTPAGLILPSILLTTVAESQRPVPQYARDTLVQIDIYDITSQAETEQLYEQIVSDLNYVITNQNTAHICWQLLGDSKDMIDTDRNVFHKVTQFTIWSVKPR